MKYIIELTLPLWAIVLFVILSGCKKDYVNTPVIETISAANITSSTKTIGGCLISDGGLCTRPF